VKREGVELLVAETTPTGATQCAFTGYPRSSQSARHLIVPLAGGDGGTTRYPDREPVHLSLVSQATTKGEAVGKLVDASPHIVLKVYQPGRNDR